MKFQRTVTANAKQCLSRVHTTSAVYGIIHWDRLGVYVSHIIPIRQLWQKLPWNFYPLPMSLQKGRECPRATLKTSDSVFHTALCSCPPPRQGDKGRQVETPHSLDRQQLFRLCSTKQNGEAWKGDSGKGSQMKTREMLRFQHAALWAGSIAEEWAHQYRSITKATRTVSDHLTYIFFSPLNERTWSCTAQT